ncbi:YfiT family bacillithiol transferase [Galbibacter mesophilus]|uniref:YfiT family bacillithiol transferase n=1 Tax=Galbibacter mesophilus TaxID=379069 RepID=UPI00191D4A9E|nr:bacillithiol transferase BstA [Galbibacter mesophilus]MCM5662749.1 bacillithiol transferase BstA [Galbibacter mesophilus]
MTTIDLKSLQYPIGKFEIPETVSASEVKKWIKVIERFPYKLENLVEDFDDLQLDTPYRPNGWTVRQVIHHMADSHMNSFIRFKWALTEDRPVIKAYFEDRWAALPDSKDGEVEWSLDLIESLHGRWVVLLKNLTETQLARTFIHPQSEKEIRLDQLIAMYAWHCEHHFAHINNLAKREEWV